MSVTSADDRHVRVALVTAAEARGLDEDLPPLVAAFDGLGAEVDIVDWDDPRVDWPSFDLALVRSTWDYHARYDAFLAWVHVAAAHTALHNPPEVLRWNTDKRYLRDLADVGIAVVPTTFLEPNVDRSAAEAPDGLPGGHVAASGGAGADRIGRALGSSGEVVVKPAVSAGARNTARYLLDDAAERARAVDHARSLLDAGRVVMVQPYLTSVDTRGETAVVVVDGTVSHALRKGPLLQRGTAMDDALFALEDMAPRQPSAAEVAVADAVTGHLAARFGRVPLYARVDLLAGPDDRPVLLELELTEPSLFLDLAPGAAERFAGSAMDRLR